MAVDRISPEAPPVYWRFTSTPSIKQKTSKTEATYVIQRNLQYILHFEVQNFWGPTTPLPRFLSLSSVNIWNCKSSESCDWIWLGFFQTKVTIKHSQGWGPIHWEQKFLHRLWRAEDNDHHFRISIQVLQANLQVKIMWEFDSISRLQKGHNASWGVMIPLSTRKSPVFSFSKFATHIASFALGGMNFCQTMLMMCFGRVGVYISFTLAMILFVG